MCGWCRRTASEEELARQYRIPIPPQLDLPISYNIAPTQNVWAIRRHPEIGERALEPLKWGLIPTRVAQTVLPTTTGVSRSLTGWPFV